MREIKFRVWDYHLNKYINDYITGTSLSLNDLFKNGSRLNGKNSLVFEQYTGLKDYNGKDVYEGDLIQDIDYGIMECKYLHGSFVWYSKNGFNIKLMNYIPNIEVIGNIYENKELLED